MYEAVPDVTKLRQGDVLRGLHIPRYSLSQTRFIHKQDLAAGGFAFAKEIITAAEPRLAVVLSQCCEFNEGKRNAFSLAGLRRIADAINGDLPVWGVTIAELVRVAKSPFRALQGGQTVEDQLRLANRIDPGAGKVDAAHVYLLEPDGVVLEEPHVVDFTQVISLRMEDAATAARAFKVLQLDEECRREFQLKLAYFYGRRI